MEINKQLFEDVLSGKLKGTFIQEDGKKLNDKLLTSIDKFTVVLNGKAFYFNGKPTISYYSGILDIVNFIPDTDMKENELTIEIPKGKIVDWDESKKQNKIVLKNKQSTYEDVCEKLLGNNFHFIDSFGSILRGNYRHTPNAALTQHQLECILAKNKLANVAAYLNDGWKPSNGSNFYTIGKNCVLENLEIQSWPNTININTYGEPWFKSDELAQQAIEILGEETVKLALEPLGV